MHFVQLAYSIAILCLKIVFLGLVLHTLTHMNEPTDFSGISCVTWVYSYKGLQELAFKIANSLGTGNCLYVSNALHTLEYFYNHTEDYWVLFNEIFLSSDHQNGSPNAVVISLAIWEESSSVNALIYISTFLIKALPATKKKKCRMSSNPGLSLINQQTLTFLLKTDKYYLGEFKIKQNTSDLLKRFTKLLFFFKA